MDEQQQTTAPADEKRSVNWWGFILWPVVFLIIYMVSMGPVELLQAKGYNPFGHKWVRAGYRPLTWAYLETPLHKPLGMYLHLWDPKQFDKNGELNLVTIEQLDDFGKGGTRRVFP